MARTKPPAPTPVSPDEVEIELYAAMQAGDIDRLMAVWSDDDEISCVHPGGPRLIGVAAIRAAFEAMFAGGGRIAVEPHRVRRLESHSSAVHSVLERIRVAAEGGEQFAWVVATNVYQKSSQGWRLVTHHASPGSAGEAQEVAETASTLH